MDVLGVKSVQRFQHSTKSVIFIVHSTIHQELKL